MVSLKDIKAIGRRIAREYSPERIILFGSYASGGANADSDVDLLVVMPFKGHPVDKAVEMRLKVRPPFPTDLLVRTPQAVRRRIAIGDPFIRNIVKHGKVLYEADRL
ncbi:MAG: hypothetical protein BIFFINMI_03941 [Phycisphaerae bacterium]|nr:hypothetical protein [Phycisphaerae bacterium]